MAGQQADIFTKPGYFMNLCRETMKRAYHLATAGCWFRGVPERYVAGADTRGRQEGRQYPWSQQVIHELSGLAFEFQAYLLGYLASKGNYPLGQGLS